MVFAPSAQLHGLRDGNLRLLSAQEFRNALAAGPSPKSKNAPRQQELLLVDFASLHAGAGQGSRQDRYTSVSRLPLVPSRRWRVADHGEVVPYRAEIRRAEQLTHRRPLRGEGLLGAKRASRRPLTPPATGCGPDPAERGRSAYRDRPASPPPARGPRSPVSHRSSIGAKPDHAAPNRASMPPGPHSLARLRIWSGAKNHDGLAPGNSGSSGDELRWVSPMRPEYFIWSPKCRCSVARNSLLPAMSTNATG